MKTLKKRTEFLAVAKGGRADRRAFVLQGLRRGDDRGTRFGYTVTKRTGNAVERNRIRRRLRAAVAALSPGDVPEGADYVLIGRRSALDMPFADLVRDLRSGLAKALDPNSARNASGHRKPRGDRGDKLRAPKPKQG
ncbi:ribonuclease P protein component [Polymorphum gilvum]|uniref:Ribonuclease P protein component n=1 Tax=Polymorphum gilvum (strain LMG 25793 / CGMCC 1.9160 / SL003B-26A1) TaxID=991905 RepID=F2J1Z3_POLGS|nr:ribonuclease P protein component [Polymorphum gilvum]ADZ72054.1 Ribonuclease P protein component [Polymorphum gilvum SL003B-26A1]